ncbi:MFS transporter [Burkholderia sp. SCN-KJ]|uniref:MFS transporter n=1 Tax=Burkholderia sp. SCN-KJ TaxID=2969248 RepID=UPI00214FC809|nr:MFS transporter [Burkholderia sp. SCN-KJ]MCR4470467.1 MFS transporter [Burkholderia sp. SCN-KJ]
MNISAQYATAARTDTSMRRVIIASSLGTMFEWYDFYLVGSLAAYISTAFFSGVNPTAAFIFTLLGFAAGFVVRPIGAIIFGRIGDLIGRKYTFLVTILIMGFATFMIGLLPTFSQIGIWAPIGFVTLRCLQGLAMGGEYGGAVTYVAEHAPNNRRGAWTACIQATAIFAIVIALLIIAGVRNRVGEAQFTAWGWRVPFLISVILLAISVWIRLKLHESPAFRKMIAEGKGSQAPLKDAFGRWSNLRLVLLGTLIVAGQAVVGYTGEFYVMFFLTKTLQVDTGTANMLMMIALLISVPIFVLAGALSDVIGRKPLIVGGCLIASLAFFPLFKALTFYVNPALARAQQHSPIMVSADPAECSFQFNPVGSAKFTTSCDVAKATLATLGLSYENRAAARGEPASIRIGSSLIQSYNGNDPQVRQAKTNFHASLGEALRRYGYPDKADGNAINYPMTILILVVLMLFVTMTYGPIAAVLVEMFPTQVRYTSMSLPINIGNGWFGGLLPATAFAIVATRGNIYSGLWYPVIVAAIAGIAGLFLLRETSGRDIAAMS